MTTAVIDAVLKQEQDRQRDQRRQVAKGAASNTCANADGDAGNELELSDAELKAPARELAAFAFSMLVDGITLFTMQHFKQWGLSSKAQNLGLLVAYDDLAFDRTPQWKFSHLTMQEALAARYISEGHSPEEVSALLKILSQSSCLSFLVCLIFMSLPVVCACVHSKVRKHKTPVSVISFLVVGTCTVYGARQRFLWSAVYVNRLLSHRQCFRL